MDRLALQTVIDFLIHMECAFPGAATAFLNEYRDANWGDDTNAFVSFFENAVEFHVSPRGDAIFAEFIMSDMERWVPSTQTWSTFEDDVENATFMESE